jgi:hypothetical protein
MITKTIDVITSDKNLLLEKLNDLLEKQIELLQKGDPAGKKFEELSLQADALVKKIKQEGLLQSAQFASCRSRLQKLYERLNMIVSAQKDETARQLNRLRKGKKTIVTYRKNV